MTVAKVAHRQAMLVERIGGAQRSQVMQVKGRGVVAAHAPDKPSERTSPVNNGMLAQA